MKNLKHLKKLSTIIEESLVEMKTEIEKVKREYQKKLITSNFNLIKNIAQGENLDELSLIEKYLDKKPKEFSDSKKKEKESTDDEEILNHMNLNGNDYFYEDKVNGNVYDNESKKVGVFKLGSIEFSNSC